MVQSEHNPTKKYKYKTSLHGEIQSAGPKHLVHADEVVCLFGWIIWQKKATIMCFDYFVKFLVFPSSEFELISITFTGCSGLIIVAVCLAAVFGLAPLSTTAASSF